METKRGYGGSGTGGPEGESRRQFASLVTRPPPCARLSPVCHPSGCRRATCHPCFPRVSPVRLKVRQRLSDSSGAGSYGQYYGIAQIFACLWRIRDRFICNEVGIAPKSGAPRISGPTPNGSTIGINTLLCFFPYKNKDPGGKLL